MILVDTSIWVDHIRERDPQLSEFLAGQRVLTHPLVLGEIEMGSIANRRAFLKSISALPFSRVALHSVVLQLVEAEVLFGRGIGYIDVHLLASTQLTPNTRLWTRDKRLHQVALELSVAYTPDEKSPSSLS